MNRYRYPPLSENQKRLQRELGDSFTKWDQPVPPMFPRFNDEYPELAQKMYGNLGPKRKSK